MILDAVSDELDKWSKLDNTTKRKSSLFSPYIINISADNVMNLIKLVELWS
jgi:hypothetical protein